MYAFLDEIWSRCSPISPIHGSKYITEHQMAYAMMAEATGNSGGCEWAQWKAHLMEQAHFCTRHREGDQHLTAMFWALRAGGKASQPRQRSSTVVEV